jgi:hypothetical protein
MQQPPVQQQANARLQERDDLGDDEYETPIPRRGRRGTIGQANRIVAGIGSSLLLIGLFLPMINFPFGIWLSFVDLPWKVTTIGVGQIADDFGEGADSFSRSRGFRGRAPSRSSWSDTDRQKSALAVFVAIASIGYPFVIFLTVGIAFLQICGGRKRGVLTILGTLSILSTVLYGLLLIALSTQEELRLTMLAVSPGFGWAVLLIGALSLTGSGLIRSQSRN